MQIHVLTLFPKMFQGPFDESVIKLAVERGLVQLSIHDIRSYTHDSHHTVDDYQYGGGPGMVMKPEPVAEAVDDAISTYPKEQLRKVPVILLSPQGRLLNQELAQELAKGPGMVLICGHYEGVDERIREGLATDDISIGDYVLTGGELAAMVVVDTVARLVPGVVGSEGSVTGDSITSGLLQHPVYTRPQVYKSQEVPPILLSGNHGEIDRWRRQQALLRTMRRRPDLLKSAHLSPADLEFLASHGCRPA